jgi:epoxyqueuosine reductase
MGRALNEQSLATRVKATAAALGFTMVGIVRAAPSPFLDAYERWISDGMHGEMGYMARPDRVDRRRDLSVILPGVRSLVVVGLDYGAAVDESLLRDPARGRIASYAWDVDYHAVMLPRLEALADWLAEATGAPAPQRAYVDTGALLERGHAYSAGLGFIGKNTMLIHPRRGSSFLLGELLTTHTFDRYDTPAFRPTMCGTCVRCLRACPTDAFPTPHVLDARRCISYLTIEHKGWIDRALRPLIGSWVFGCDVCQDVCPFQRFSPAQHAPAIAVDRCAPPLLDLLALDEAGFAARFGGTPVERIRRERLVRNACVAAGNWGDPAAVAPLIRLLSDPSPLVRGHAAWALGRIGTVGARTALAAALALEAQPQVREELAKALIK